MKKIRVIDWEKIEKLPTANAMLDEKYGKEGTPSREAFNREADKYYRQVISEPDDGWKDEPVDEEELNKAKAIMEEFMKDEYVEDEEEEEVTAKLNEVKKQKELIPEANP